MGTTTGKILGKVTDAAGRPVSGLAVYVVSGPAHADIAAMTADDGTFSLGALAPGSYVVSAGETVPVRVVARKIVYLEVTLAAEHAIDESQGEGPAEQLEPDG
jgi:hypothetical protein